MYIIAKPEVTSDDVMVTANEHYWLWLDETEETEEKPYTLSFQASQSETNIAYQEEHKDIFEARYFVITGEDTKTAAEQIHSSFAVYNHEELPALFEMADKPRARGSAIYQLGIASTGQPFRQATANIFQKGLADRDAGVRAAALWALAWPHWPELRPLVEQATKDSAADVSDTARSLLKVFEQ